MGVGRGRSRRHRPQRLRAARRRGAGGGVGRRQGRRLRPRCGPGRSRCRGAPAPPDSASPWCQRASPSVTPASRHRSSSSASSRPKSPACSSTNDLIATVSTIEGVAALAAAARVAAPQRVHVKVDTGMHRVGAHPDDLVALTSAIDDAPALLLDGVFTHLAVADELTNPYDGSPAATLRPAPWPGSPTSTA